MYLSEEFLSWPCTSYEGSAPDVDPELLTSCHDWWRQAKNKLKNDPSKYDRFECIMSLKRAVDSRLKTIDKVYSFNKLPNLQAKKKVLEKHQDYGLIRTTLLIDLLDVRNLLEHQDTTPPDVDKCHYYVDIVWYFLKSLDSLLKIKFDNIIYEDDESYSELPISLDANWDVSFRGKVNRHLVSDTDKQNFIEIIDMKIKDNKNDSEMIDISGAFKMTEDLKTKFAREYFGALGYWYEDHA